MKLKFHYSFYLIFIIALFSGFTIQLVIFTTSIILHELGHLLVARCFMKQKYHLIITALGGIIEIDDYSLKGYQSLLINIAGISVNCLIILISHYIFNVNKDSIIINYNKLLIAFNLLPIYPLDGYRIFCNFLTMLTSFKKTISISFAVSISAAVFVFIIALKHLSFSLIIISCFLFHKNIILFKSRKIILLKRIIYQTRYT